MSKIFHTMLFMLYKPKPTDWKKKPLVLVKKQYIVSTIKIKF